MDFLKNLFKDDDSIIGLSGFKDFTPKIKAGQKPQNYYNIFTRDEKIYSTDTKKNFLLS